MFNFFGSILKILHRYSLSQITKQRLLSEKVSSALLIIDLQAKILAPIQSKEQIVWNIKKIVDTFKILKKDIYATEQYPEKLGKTIEIGISLDAYSKRDFSCIRCTDMIKRLKKHKIRTLILCGVETHVCILQSCIDLINDGYEIYLLADAIGSRTLIDHKIAIARLREIGVKIYSTEAVIFELCKSSEYVYFKAISQIVKRKMS